MSWVRIDDCAMEHRKVLKLTDAQFRLWLRGLCYCQRNLTDGFIPDEAMKLILATAANAKGICDAGLWEAQNGGFQVHDFLDWNDSSERVRQRREAKVAEKAVTRDRMQRWRDAKKGKRNAISDADVTPLHERDGDVTVTLLTKPNQTKVQKDPPSESLSAPSPPFTKPRPERGAEHGRIFLHRWQQDALLASLGAHADGFDLDGWLWSLDKLATDQGLVLHRQVVWPWVQSQLAEEVRRRGLPVAAPSTAPSLGKTSTRALNMLEQLQG